jgi:hypothetical protein
MIRRSTTGRDRADHGPLHDLSHDRTALDDPPLDHRLDHAALADAALRGATLDDTPLVRLVIDDRATATRKLVVLIGIDQPTLDARAVEVVFVRIDLVPATNLRLGRRSGDHGCAAQRERRQAGQGQCLKGEVFYPILRLQSAGQRCLSSNVPLHKV